MKKFILTTFLTLGMTISSLAYPMYINAPSGLNLRLEPNTESDKVVALPYREVLEVEDYEDNEWLKTTYKDITCYVKAEYLSAEKPKFIGNFKLTAYCSCSKCCGKWSKYKKTRSGTDLVEGVTVACNSIPLGTEITIDGHDYIVQDTGNMKNNVVDIYVSTHEEAKKRGVTYADVYYKN